MELSYTLRNVLIGSSLLGIVAGVLGSFALLRRQSLLGDALAHSVLPGICIAFLLSGMRTTLPLMGGALVTGIAGALLVLAIVRWSRIKQDSAIGIVLSVFYATGIVLLTRIQRLPGGNQSGLDKFLFGQAAALLEEDLYVMAGLGALVLIITMLLFKEFKILVFDPAFAASLGFPVRRLEALLTALLVVIVVFGLQTVGVVLMVAALVTPAAAARQWTDRLGAMVLLAAGIGGVSGAAGAIASATMARLPTGPTIVLISSSILVLSLLLAPRRGLLWARLRARAAAARIRREHLLKDLYRLGEARGRLNEFVSWPELMGVRGQSMRELGRSARRLVREGHLELRADTLRLTPEGLAEAEKVTRKHRLWELYLTRRLELASDHVHRDAEAMEHVLTDAAVAELEALLGHPTVDPHGRTIPQARRP
ncbi:MAG: iron chelate uptake ABC transporter family permease subunit [Planctomycetota bacterium]